MLQDITETADIQARLTLQLVEQIEFRMLVPFKMYLLKKDYFRDITNQGYTLTISLGYKGQAMDFSKTFPDSYFCTADVTKFDMDITAFFSECVSKFFGECPGV